MKNVLLLIVGFLVLPNLAYSQFDKSAENKIQSFLSANKNQKKSTQSSQFEVVSIINNAESGISKIQATQQIDGISIHNAIITLAYKDSDNVLGTSTFTDMKANTDTPTLSKTKALSVSAKYHDVITPSVFDEIRRVQASDDHTLYSKSEYFASDPEVRLVYLKDENNNQLRLAWLTQLHTLDMQHYYVDFVDAVTGEVLQSEDKVLHCSFGPSLVYDASPEEQAIIDARHKAIHLESARKWNENQTTASHTDHASCTHNHNSTSVVAPANRYLVLDLPAEAPNDDSADSDQVIVQTAGDPEASPYGWTSLDGTLQLPYTHGNNVFAFYDPSPGPLGGVPNPAAAAQATSNNPLGNQDFIYHWDLTQDPEYVQTSTNNTMPNRNAAIVNLFYQNNLVHDIFYNFGFDEEGRNFQFENFGKGGLGNDNVLAQAQDGGGTNNANMLTLLDGVNPQMQMYLWTGASAANLVQLTSVSSASHVEAGDEFLAIQGALYSAATPYDLYENPVLDKPFVLVNDGCGDSKGCGLGAGGVGAIPCNTVADAIVLIDRGDCSFVEKVDGAQKGGAAGVIIINNNSSSPDEVAAMGGTDPTGNTITIPAVMVSYNTGLVLKETLADGVTIIGSLKQDEIPAPRRDGDFDNGIIAHEYGHGISSRTSPQTLTGGSLSGSEQGGEGWSDYYALYLTTTSSDLTDHDNHPNGMLPSKGIGTYVTYTESDGPGIRPRRYSIDMEVNEYTFAGTTNGGVGIGNSAEITVPHGVGFIWCTMLWELTQNLVDEYGFSDETTYNPPSGDIQAVIDNHAGNNLALKLIQEGISLQAPSPSFLDMRDAILLADELHYDGAHSCLIWSAFAKRGLGVDAINPTNNIGDERDGYATPCNTTQSFHDVTISAPSVIENESILSYDIKVINHSDVSSQNVVATDVAPQDFTLTEVTGADYTRDDRILTFTIDELEANTTTNITVSGYVKTNEASEIVESYSFETGTEGWIAVTGGPNTFTRNTDGQAQDGDSHFHTTNNGLTGANTTLQSPTLPVSDEQRQIRFYHKYDTDSGYDGGYLEYSVDGIEWLPLAVQQNGYNETLDGLFNLTYTGPAFSGSISEYIESAALIPEDAVNVRFVFSEDSGLGGGDGWFIDNIRIVNNPVSISSTATVKDPESSGSRIYVDDTHTLILQSSKPVFDVKPSMSITPGVVNGNQAAMRVIVDLIEMSGNNTSGPLTVRIAKNDLMGFEFDPTLTEVGGFPVDNDLFQYSENFLYWEFTTNADIIGDQYLRFGFTGDFVSSGQGDMPVTVRTKTVSGLENNSSNNKDVENVNYSEQD